MAEYDVVVAIAVRVVVVVGFSLSGKLASAQLAAPDRGRPVIFGESPLAGQHRHSQLFRRSRRIGESLFRESERHGS